MNTTISAAAAVTVVGLKVLPLAPTSTFHVAAWTAVPAKMAKAAAALRRSIMWVRWTKVGDGWVVSLKVKLESGERTRRNARLWYLYRVCMGFGLGWDGMGRCGMGPHAHACRSPVTCQETSHDPPLLNCRMQNCLTPWPINQSIKLQTVAVAIPLRRIPCFSHSMSKPGNPRCPLPNGCIHSQIVGRSSRHHLAGQSPVNVQMGTNGYKSVSLTV